MRSLLTDRIFRTHIGTSRATYLRGLAAIGVLTIHYGGFGLRSIFPSESFMGKVLNNFVDLGGQGPTAFFVASGYVLSKVFLENPKKRAFVISRYFRLAPTYILISIFAMNIGDLSNQLSLSLAIKKVLFLDIFFDDAYGFNPIGIGYYVVIEFWLSFVLILNACISKFSVLRKTNSPSTLFLFLSFMVSYSSADIALLVGLKESQSEFLKFQFFFVLGAQIYEIKARKKVWINLHWIILPFAILPLFLDTYLGYIAATLSCLFLLTERNHPNIIKVWPLVAIGNICYSLYLIHIPVFIYCDNKLPALHSFAVASLALLASIATFFLIEVPFIQVGKFINMRITAGKYQVNL